jgi:CRISPR-associated protein (TIGR03984 family)
VLSNSAKSLPAAKLLDVRAFGPEDELFVWRDAEGLHARHRHDRGGEPRDTLPEEQLLWGTERARNGGAPAGFTMLVDGDAGLAHTPPLDLDDRFFNGSGHRPARLHLRHYIRRDEDTGIARIDDSRLIDLTAEKP